jgi:ubiquinone/menaquinone biosynthesis C-methylase UbiE
VIPDPAALARIIIAMNYDQSGIATTCDEARALTPARRRRWQRLLSAHVDRTDISLVVDLGCGTGRFSEMLAAELGALVIGFDPSEKMIDQPRRKPVTSLVVFGRASAHELPLPEGCVDLVFMSQIYHHLPDPAAVAGECRRVLRVDGYFCIRTGTRENDVVVPNFFPAVRAKLDADLPSSEDVMSNFVAAGFTPRHHEIVTEAVAPDWPSFVRKSALRADSFLARLSDTEFDQGMAALSGHLAINPGEAVTEEIDWFVFTKRAWPPRIGKVRVRVRYQAGRFRPVERRSCTSVWPFRGAPQPYDRPPARNHPLAAPVKGFRTPAGHGRDEGRGGRRPKSLEGGNRGGFCAGDGVGLWGFSRSAWLDFSAADRNDDRASTATPVLVALGAVEVVVSY